MQAFHLWAPAAHLSWEKHFRSRHGDVGLRAICIHQILHVWINSLLREAENSFLCDHIGSECPKYVQYCHAD